MGIDFTAIPFKDFDYTQAGVNSGQCGPGGSYESVLRPQQVNYSYLIHVFVCY